MIKTSQRWIPAKTDISTMATYIGASNLAQKSDLPFMYNKRAVIQITKSIRRPSQKAYIWTSWGYVLAVNNYAMFGIWMSGHDICSWILRLIILVARMGSWRVTDSWGN